MKVFIVFLALLIVNVNLMNFHGGLGRYIELQNIIKMASEECAAQAALLLDEGAYAQGQIVFDYEAGQRDGMNYLAHVCNSLGVEKGYELSFLYEDDLCSYSVGNIDRLPRVAATISVDVGSIFTGVPLACPVIQRSSCYEIK